MNTQHTQHQQQISSGPRQDLPQCAATQRAPSMTHRSRGYRLLQRLLDRFQQEKRRTGQRLLHVLLLLAVLLGIFVQGTGQTAFAAPAGRTGVRPPTSQTSPNLFDPAAVADHGTTEFSHLVIAATGGGLYDLPRWA